MLLIHTYSFLVLFILKPAYGQSLFDSENVTGSRKSGVNLPPKFLPGGDMENFRLPEDTPVGTIVSVGQNVSLNLVVITVCVCAPFAGVSSER